VQVQSRVVLLTLLGIASVTALVIVAWTRGEPQSVNRSASERRKAPTHKTPAPAATQPVQARLIVKASRGPCWLQVHKTSATGRSSSRDARSGTEAALHGTEAVDHARSAGEPRHRVERPLSPPAVGGVKTLIVTPHGIRPAV